MTGDPASACYEDFWASLYAATSSTFGEVAVDGVTVAVTVWDAQEQLLPARETLLLIHGGAAQRQWWDHMVPLLRGVARVVAIDLSGHGDSGWRECYSLDRWTDEVTAVAGALCPEPPVLVGHSLGGLVAMNAAQRNPGSFRSVLALDSPLRQSADTSSVRRDKIAARAAPTYASHAEAVASYKTFPRVENAPAAVMAHLARTAYHCTDGKWVRSYDPRVYRRPQTTNELLVTAKIPTVWVRAEHGFIDGEMARRIPERLGPLGALVEVPQAGHHLTLEQPLATAWLINLHLQRGKDESP